jgi:UDP-N-acetylglucosamine 2-epimerase (non-hydrolysing)
MRILSVFGTRPEAIKMAPLISALARDPQIDARVCVTGQHDEMLRQALRLFAIVPDHDLKTMSPNQTLNGLTARIIAALDAVIDIEKPDRVLVQGDTTSAMAGALAAFHRGIPVAHVEAGLRTALGALPWPEEGNRRIVDATADLLFPPTDHAKRNLLAENLASRRIFVTGNTVIDALALVEQRLDGDLDLARSISGQFPFLDPSKKLLLATVHRRENFGANLSEICDALVTLAERRDLQIVFPLHLNPNVRAPLLERLGRVRRIHLVEPLDYLAFTWMMRRAYAVLTDSGGVQEEATALGKPVAILRETTERQESVAAGVAMLVGSDAGRIVPAIRRLLDDSDLYARLATPLNLYGDGRASERILVAIKGGQPSEFRSPRSEGPEAF